MLSDRQTVAMLQLGKLPCATLLPSSLPPSVMLPDGQTQPEPESKGAGNALHTAQPPTAQSREEKDRDRSGDRQGYAAQSISLSQQYEFT